jgi:hypothetical protein
MQQQRAVQAEMAKALEKPLAPFNELARQNMELWARMQASMLAAFTPAATAAAAPDAGAPAPDAAPAPDTQGKQG